MTASSVGQILIKHLKYLTKMNSVCRKSLVLYEMQLGREAWKYLDGIQLSYCHIYNSQVTCKKFRSQSVSVCKYYKRKFILEGHLLYSFSIFNSP